MGIRILLLLTTYFLRFEECWTNVLTMSLMIHGIQFTFCEYSWESIAVLFYRSFNTHCKYRPVKKKVEAMTSD